MVQNKDGRKIQPHHLRSPAAMLEEAVVVMQWEQMTGFLLVNVPITHVPKKWTHKFSKLNNLYVFSFQHTHTHTLS